MTDCGLASVGRASMIGGSGPTTGIGGLAIDNSGPIVVGQWRWFGS